MTGSAYTLANVRVKQHNGKRFLGTTESSKVADALVDIDVPDQDVGQILTDNINAVVGTIVGISPPLSDYACPVCSRKTQVKQNRLLTYCETCGVTRRTDTCVKQMNLQFHLDTDDPGLLIFSDTLQEFITAMPEDMKPDGLPMSVQNFTDEQLELCLLTCPAVQVKYRPNSNIVSFMALADL